MAYDAYSTQTSSQIVSLLRFIPQAQWKGLLDGTNTFDCTSAFASAKAYLTALPSGGILTIPPGKYYVTSIDWTNTNNTQFNVNIGIQGSGPFATIIESLAVGTLPVLNMAGRNDATISDLTISGLINGGMTGILLARNSTSTNCNGNVFTNIYTQGYFSNKNIVSIADEDTTWYNCYHQGSNNNLTLLWSGTDPARSGLTFSGGTTMSNGQTLISGSNTAKAMFGCYFILPYTNARMIVFDTQAEYAMHGCSLVVGNAPGAHLVTYTVGASGNFDGPLGWTDTHFEAYTSNNAVIHYLDTANYSGPTYFIGINSHGGTYGVDSSASIMDFDRTKHINQPIIQGCTFEPYWTSTGTTDSYIYVYGIYASIVSGRSLLSNGGLVVLGLIQDCGEIGATAFVMPASYTASAPYEILGTAVPTSGTWSRGAVVKNSSLTVGQPLGWACTKSGTLGTLNSGLTTGTIALGAETMVVNSTTGLFVGAAITVATVDSFVVRTVIGTTVYLDHVAPSAGSGVAVSFNNATFTALANL